jgi:hypothetical protein
MVNGPSCVAEIRAKSQPVRAQSSSHMSHSHTGSISHPGERALARGQYETLK